MYRRYSKIDLNRMTKAEKTKEHIVEKTALLFNEKGFAGTSFNDIMQATGLSKGCIYGHFTNKDDIALEVFDYNIQRLSNYLDVKTNESQHSIERLLAYPKVIRNFLTIPIWEGGCPILNTSTEADDTHPKLKEKASLALSSWQDKIASQITRGIERKEIKTDTDAKEIAIVIIYMIESAVMQTKVSGKTTELNIAMNFLEKLIQNIQL